MLEQLIGPLALDGVAFLLPAAPGGSWYPGRFDSPAGANEPWLTRALDRCERALERLRAAGVPSTRIALVGFSQGACLAATLLAERRPQVAAAAILTGALIVPAGQRPRVARPLDGVVVTITCGPRDEWVPLDRARASAEALAAARAKVRFLVRDDPLHRISAEDVDAVRQLLAPLRSPP